MILFPFVILSFLITLTKSSHSTHSSRTSLSSSSSTFKNLNINRMINLKNKIILIENQIRIQNLKDDPVYSYRYLLSKNSSSSLVNIHAKMTYSVDDETTTLPITKSFEDDNFIYYDISFKKEPMNSKEIRYLIVNEDHFEKLQFFPKKIPIKDNQYALFIDTVNCVSLYETESQVTTVMLPNDNTEIVKMTTARSNKLKDKIVYTVKDVFPSMKYEQLYIHYLYNEPFTVMNYAFKSYQISHWGNIAVDEDYQLKNIGALLDGEFGRVDYESYSRKGGKNALRYLQAKLPIRAWGLWYRDEIGNVTTSRASREWNDVSLVLYPRFPILGGWKSNFGIGYNLPSKFHIKTNDQGNYVVNLTFGMPFEDLLAKEYTVRVALPEGAEVTKVDLPLEKGEYEITYDKSYSTLDLIGRQNVVIKMKNVYDSHKVDFQIYYNYSKVTLIRKPLILILYFLIVFIALIISFRAKISLDKTEKVKEE